MKLKNSVRIFRLLGAMSLAVGATVLSSCVDPYIYGNQRGGQPGANRGAEAYKASLVQAITRADKIVIKEHSNQADFSEVVSDINSAPYYKYGSTELTLAEKNGLLNNVQRMSSRAKSEYTLCAFTPHHTIELYEQGRLVSKIRVCYECSDVKWNGTTSQVPADLINALSPTIRRAGFTTNKSWKAEAASRYTPPRPEPKPDPKPTGPPTAKKIPGKPGHVYNPFNQNEVDVDGIPSGTKVRDPHDPDETHIFKVP